MQKSNKYYSETRPELLKYYPIGIKKLLDIGCSSATFSSTLKSRSPIEIWGIEMNEASAEVANQKIDKVLVGDVNEIVETLPINYFDCIGCNDILEHLYNPEDLLVNLKKTISEDGILITSIPNFLIISNLKNLLLWREWNYTEEGTLDFTHIRFFTKKSIVKMFKRAGYEIINIEGINETGGWKWKLFNLLTFGFFREFGYIQFVCIAKPLK